MRYFFLVNRLLPNACIEVKFCLNNLLNSIGDEQLQYRILNAIYLIDIDLRSNNSIEFAVIDDFLLVLGDLLKITSSDEMELIDKRYLAISTFLDVFFLLLFPENCNFIKEIKREIKRVGFLNFWIIKQLINELYSKSRESCFKHFELHFSENISSENKNSEVKENSYCFGEPSNNKLEVDPRSLLTIDKLFEFNDNVKVGIPSSLNFGNVSKTDKRINFFYVEERDINAISRIIVFSIKICGEMLQSLSVLLNRFQSNYQCNPVSILIHRLIICRYSEFKGDTIRSLEQLISISVSKELLNSFFECSLLINNEELYCAFDFYRNVDSNEDFLEIIIAIKHFIWLQLKETSNSSDRYLNWIRTESEFSRSKCPHSRRISNRRFRSSFELISFILSYFKDIFITISKKLDNLAYLLRKNELNNLVDFDVIYNKIKFQVNLIQIFKRCDLLDIFCGLFSVNFKKEGPISIFELERLYSNSIFNIYYLEALKRANSRPNCGELVSELSNLEQLDKNFLNFKITLKNKNRIIESILVELWRRSVMVIFTNVNDLDFQRRLSLILKAISEKDQSILWYYLTSDYSRILDTISKLHSDRRRVGAIQCCIYCIEIELKRKLEQAFIKSKFEEHHLQPIY
ncbi:hypothetical protein HWI79_1540 [Cryptosporidium felis]|nr:hypothetical protein HWI79_1540 [Cryptosporidium felis]